MTIDSDEVIEMSIKISLGAVEPPSSFNKEQRDQWEQLLVRSGIFKRRAEWSICRQRFLEAACQSRKHAYIETIVVF